jgi:nickel/cobalt exporter
VGRAVARHRARRGFQGALLLTLTLLAMLIQRPADAAAHPLDEYLQALYLTVAPGGVTLELDLSPGVLIVPPVIALIDNDGDGTISDAEGQAYAHAVLHDISLEIDQQPYTLSLTNVEIPAMLNLTAGVGTIRLAAAAAPDPSTPRVAQTPGAHQAHVQNLHAPVKSVYQSTVALGPDGGIEVSQQRRDERYQSLRVDYIVTTRAQPAPVAGTGAGASNLPDVTAQRGWLVDALYQPAASPWLLMTALALSAVLGGFHALTPGHGKALLASYLVGSQGTVRHAVVLGGTVTFTHTASVIATGLLALIAGNLIVPNLMVPTLELGSGLLVVVLGVRLVRARWRSLRADHQHGDVPAHEHAHEYAHEQAHTHVHQDGGHDHGGHAHPHPASGVRWRDLATMGVSGGLTPCPEAIGILLVAIGLNRIALGLGLIVAFSLGLAAVLCLLGLLIVRSSGLVDRLGATGQRTQRWLPLCSAIIVTGLGIAISAKGALAYLS